MVKASLSKKEALTRMARRGTTKIRWSSLEGFIEWSYIPEEDARNWDGSSGVRWNSDSNKKVLQQKIVINDRVHFNNWW